MNRRLMAGGVAVLLCAACSDSSDKVLSPATTVAGSPVTTGGTATGAVTTTTATIANASTTTAGAPATTTPLPNSPSKPPVSDVATVVTLAANTPATQGAAAATAPPLPPVTTLLTPTTLTPQSSATTTTIPGSAQFPLHFNSLKDFSKGGIVFTVQHDLNAFGYNLTVDGEYGPACVVAVKDFQANHGLVVDGLVGAQTYLAIVNALPAG